jgi:hypothetical protein
MDLNLKVKQSAQRILFSLMLVSFFTVTTYEPLWARKPGVAGEADVKSGNFDAAVAKLAAMEIKNADEWYLLGRAYMGLGQKAEAYQAWTEALHINEKLSKRKKWTFLFPPNKPLKGKQKKKIKEDFEDEYKELNATISRMKKMEARDLKNKAATTRIDAKKKDAKEKQLNKMAAAKTKTIDSKQRMADRKARTNKRTRQSRRAGRSGRSSWLGLIVFGVIFGIIIYAIFFGRRGGGRGRGRRVQYYDVGYDDNAFMGGPFYYRGRYYRDHNLFYRDHGYYYSNRMYRDNYDRWGRGEAYDEALDADIHHDIDEREDLYNAAAEQGYEADVMRADAEHYEQDAHELEQEIGDGDEAAGFFNDSHEFEDDEFADDEAYSDGDDGGFEDDYDDGDYDDGGYDDGDYDDGDYDDGGYDDGGFGDDPDA